MRTLLVHGLGRTPVSLFGLAAALRRDRHHTRFLGYSATLESRSRIVRRLVTTLHDLAKTREPVGLIGHSLGGLLLRTALAEVPELAVHHLVMLGTPGVVPRIAQLAWRWVPGFRVFAGDCGRFLISPDALASVPEPRVPFTVIAGTAGPRGRWSPFRDELSDGIVTVAETRWNETVRPEEFPALHSFLMDSPAIRARIQSLLRK
jgi:pimeloyl-ACP methyl ester carboxylesterase